jgi:hypothetical protein
MPSQRIKIKKEGKKMDEELEVLLNAYKELYHACNEEGIDIETHRNFLSVLAQRVANGASISAVMEQVKEVNLAREIRKYKKIK